MLLQNLIKNPPKNLKRLKVRGLAINSKKVKKGFIFFAIKGNKSNGEDYISQAIKNGAFIIICSKNCKFQTKKANIIKTKNVKNYLSKVISKFYKLKPKNIIAVTGTNGKTSVADFFYQILKSNNIPVASIGTLGIRYKNKFMKTNLTSPDIITLHENLEKLKKNKIDNVIIEASSHGLDQNRLDNLNFKAGIFTNFSQDHLDYHKTMKAYLDAKLILFSKLLSSKRSVIVDKSIKEYSIIKRISQKRKLRLLDIERTIVQLKNKSLSLQGSFQIKNLSMAILAARLCNLNEVKINHVLKKIKNVNGRLDLIKKYPNNIRVFIDYAHTPDALREVLKTIKNIYNNNISLVFGCGGERDFKKRRLMAKIAKSFSKKIYVTDDNPRKENPKKIRKEIVKHLKGSNYFNIGNRSKAIKASILNAKPNETILIAGKGHENYQDYGNKIISISDRQIIKRLKINKKILSLKKQNYLFNSEILNRIIKRKKFYKFDGLALDSRDIKKDNLFIAIKGKNNDGNKFIPRAISKGASYVVSSKNNKKNKRKTIKVDDPISFLNKFAQLKRKNCYAKILAITGSAGKTSLKNMLNILLKSYGFTYASPRSFNNHYGVPISLSNLSSYHQYGVFEVGMSKTGEINKLSKMIKPSLAIITNIAEAHIENFKNIKGIAKAKSEIINNIENNGTVILNRDDKFFHYLNKKAKLRNIKVVTFGKSKKSDVHLINSKKKEDMNKVFISVGGSSITLRIKNINIYNVLASLAAIKELGLSLQKTIKIFKNFEPSEGRGKIHKIKRYKKTFRLIDESYNANPFSVKNALNNFFEIKKDRCKKYLLLGDMLELGNKSEIYHKKLSGLINSSDIDKVFIKGEKSLFTYQNLKKNKRGNIFQCNQDIDFILKNIIANNDYLMIKGSNATGLNVISNAMIKGI
ncbi:MAG: UDP-N-acetylmuramoyl-L-alanyl-D-glutamate--2,6-diaminopimelate ligase [Candidatus Pelagibacter sp. TMED153]|nr:MAG: UDP-N-acetylmuramoyl-L-alanyl-D-glutamate--2,6-diaminopimelate ligase [Candidatus Pelagibacter sp. TMED153]